MNNYANGKVKNVLFQTGRTVGCVLLLCLLILTLPSTAKAIPNEEMRTLFLIGDIADYAGDMVPLQAYIIFGDQLILAETWWVDTREGGAVGLAVDQENELLFMSFEFDDTIDVFSARDASFLTQINLPGTDDLAGMVVHQGNGHLYVVDRNENDVFVFDTNNNFALVEHWVLSTSNGVFGIDLLGDNLYVTDLDGWDNDVRWYNIYSKQEVGHITLPARATGIVVMDDVDNPSNGPLVFDTSFDGTCVFDPCNMLQKYAIGSGLTDSVDIDVHGKGVSANPPAGIVYVAQGYERLFAPDARLKVVDASTLQILNYYELDTNWRPTDLLASTIPFGGTVSKTCTSHPSGVIQMGNNVTFEIEIVNKSAVDLVVIPLEDVYDTSHLTFLSANPAPTDPSNDGQIEWADLTFAFGQDLGPDEVFVVELEFEATTDCTEDLEGSNLGRVEEALDATGHPMYAAGVFDYVIECGCLISADCDDGLWCNGEEYCDVDNKCKAGDAPCPDDTLFCNGTESCNEILNRCETTGDPCPDDGAYCNGDETCNEGSDTCDHSGDPCPDDGLFCNGDESCNEIFNRCDTTGDPCPDDGEFCNGDETCNEGGDTCDHSGDPCPDDGLFCNGDESCNESTDQCDTTGDPCPDDGEFCNGDETCNEGGDTCDHSGDPCPDDGLYCNGDESCNESTDQCDTTGDPCPDDGEFCNGDETCNEGGDTCDHSGDPCPEDGLYCNGLQSCNETTDSCNSTGNPCQDDAVYCNGAETCNEKDDSCESSGDPCIDDGEFCNGSESCDEQNDTCLHSGSPCADDSVFCNGQEVCDEESEACNSTGDPCSDDGKFCNGTESCDEQTEACVSSGDPCEPDETCDELNDICQRDPDIDDDDTEGEGEGEEELWPKGEVTGGCCGCD